MADEADDVLAPLPAPTNGSVPSMPRSNSMSAASEDSQTAQEFINSQLQLEADAREAMPYQFDTCTRPLGPLRQTLYSCLTCNPPPTNPTDPYTAAGVCYSCSISCHGEHELVELFSKRNFVCDCGTSRIPETAPCNLRLNETTGTKGGVTGEMPVATNKYNHNYANRFCGCAEAYNPHQEKGTMFQCVGLGTVEDGGCGEDWWHPECIVGLPRDWYKHRDHDKGDAPTAATNGASNDAAVTTEPTQPAEAAKEEHPVPPGFPQEDDFLYFICYKCIDANPWIKRYAGASGFLPAVFYKPTSEAPLAAEPGPANPETLQPDLPSRKRKMEDGEAEEDSQQEVKRQRSVVPDVPDTNGTPSEKAPTAISCDYKALPPAPGGQLSLFCKDDFREHICRCPDCFPRLKPFPQLLEEEDTYEPPLSEDGDAADGGQSVGTGSLLDRGEAALSNMDRVRAIEGVMVYNHLKDKVKSFLQPFAESGQAVGAEDIKAYFEKLRGDAEGMKQAAAGADASGGSGGDDGDGRKEQRGY